MPSNLEVYIEGQGTRLVSIHCYFDLALIRKVSKDLIRKVSKDLIRKVSKDLGICMSSRLCCVTNYMLV